MFKGYDLFREEQSLHTKNITFMTHKQSVQSYPREVHAQFELREQVENDAPLVVQDTQVLLFVILRICHLFSGADVFQPCVVL